MATKKKELAKPVATGHGIYSESMVDKICARISKGESLVKICEDDGMPAFGTFMRWLQENKHEGKE